MTDAASSSASEPPPDLSIRARPPSPRRLSRKVLLAGALSAGGVIALALFFGLSERPDRRSAENAAIAAAGGPPESIANAASQYQASDLPNTELQPPSDMLWGDHNRSETAELAPPTDPAWRGGGAAEDSAPSAAPAPSPDAVARGAPILFGADGRSPASSSSSDNAVDGAGARANFIASQRIDDVRLDAELLPPRSRYELLAGSVIPAALVTELNSDLPGRVIALVTSNVYDTVSGEYLLIPQGARLIGTYDSSGTSYGDQRLLLVWNRLIFPNGWSISLRGMEAADPSGASGLRDQTDYHFGRLASAIGLSAIISVVADNSEDDDETSLSQSVGDAAATQAAQTGSRLIDRELTVRPTLRIRTGGAVRVLVTRDIELRPYRARP
jgi:type IV secretory pathway VirB10-like protein